MYYFKDMKKQIFGFLFLAFIASVYAAAGQDVTPKWTPEEIKELFGYCERPELIRQLKISPEMADRIGEMHYWALLQKLAVEANTNVAYATPNEVETDLFKKYKTLGLSGDQLKTLLEYRKARPDGIASCPVIILTALKPFDTIPQPRALQLYKTKYRKLLIEKLGINGKQADQVFETEVWKQKEALTIDAIPATDFNRIRKTVALYKQRDHRYKVIGLTDEQIEAAVQFFAEHLPY